MEPSFQEGQMKCSRMIRAPAGMMFTSSTMTKKEKKKKTLFYSNYIKI